MTNQHSFWNAATLLAVSITFSGNAQEGPYMLQDPQEGATGDVSDNSWFGEITVENAAVRCGANESYYPMQFLTTGDIVRVVGKRQNWYQIVTDGRAFNDIVGYVKYPEKDSAMFFVEGNTGTSNAEMEIIAKNIESDELYRSWRPVYRLNVGDTVTVLDTEKKEPGTLHRDAYIVHTVDIPSGATAWVNVTCVIPATESAVSKAEADNPESTDGSTETSFYSSESGAAAAVSESDEEALAMLTLSELEDAWSNIAKEPVMGAEISPLHDLYGQLLEENLGDLVIERIAAGRMKQLEIWKNLKSQKIRIEDLRTNLGSETGAVNEYMEVMNTYSEYAIVGRLALSNTFNGKIRPFMYRVQNKSGRTVGYLPAKAEWDLSTMIGQVVGVNGNIEWDPSWRVNVVHATGFDLLSPATAEVKSDIQ